VKDGDIVLVRVAENEIKEIIVPEILPDLTINSFSKKDWINVGGTKYDYANSAQYDTNALYQYSNSNLKELTYNVVLDMYGYLIGIEQNEEPDQYVFITGNDGGASDLHNAESEMAAIFLDGTMKVIKVNMKDSKGVDAGAIVNTWCTYTVDSKDVYTLEAVSTSYNEDHGQWAQNIKDGTIAGGGAGDKNGYTNGNIANTYTIDKGHVSLMASSDGLASDRRVYGNDKTVYINVSTAVINTKTQYTHEKPAGTATTDTGNGISDIKDANTKPAGTPAADKSNYYVTTNNVNLAVIIDDVDSITTGVKNASILVKDVVAGDYTDSANAPYGNDDVAVPKSEIYTLYEGGDVIAVITIGEDQGTTSKYAYVHSDDVAFEEYGHGTSEKWRWEREVIMDGKIETLREISDGNYAKIDTAHMDQGCWYKISFDADGNVRKVEDTSKWPSNRWGNDVMDVEDYYDLNQDLVILEVNYTGSAIASSAPDKGHLSGGLQYVDGTLYTDYNNRKGFSVATSSVNVVYANAKLNSGVKAPTGNFADVSWFDETIVKGTGETALKSALRAIDSRDAGYFCGVLTAVIEDGVATTIIINDTYGEYVDQGGSEQIIADKYYSKVDQTITTGLSNLDMSNATNYSISNTFEITMNVLKSGNLTEQIKEYLAYMKYTNIGNVTFDATLAKYVVTADAPNGAKDVQLTLNPSSDMTEVATITVDSTEKYVVLDGTNDNLDDVGVTTGKHAKMVLNGVASAIDSAAIGSTQIKDGAVYTSDAYTKVTAADITTAATFTTSTCKYTVTFALGTGDGVKGAANTYYLAKDATLVATIAGDANMATDLSGASKTKDTVTVTATGMGGTGTAVVFGTGTGENLNAKTITITGPATTVSDVTVTWTATTA